MIKVLTSSTTWRKTIIEYLLKRMIDYKICRPPEQHTQLYPIRSVKHAQLSIDLIDIFFVLKRILLEYNSKLRLIVSGNDLDTILTISVMLNKRSKSKQSVFYFD